MTHDKNGTKIYSGEMIKYNGKLWTFESQIGGHINVRNKVGDLISIAAHDVEAVATVVQKPAQAQSGITTTENVESAPEKEGV